MFLDLPACDHQPDAGEQDIDKEAAASCGHGAESELQRFAGVLCGRSLRNRFNSSSLKDFRGSIFARSASVKAASWVGLGMMCGVRKIISSVFESLRCWRLNKLPSTGMSPRNGILVSFFDFASWMRPPMMTVWPSGVTVTVSADRVLMALAKMPELICTEVVGSIAEIWGETIISTIPSGVMNGVTFKMTPTSL